jgi:elongation factor G
LDLVVESYEEPTIYSDKTPSLLKVAVVSGLRNSLLDQTVMIGPVSDLEITVDDSYVGNVLSLLQKREGQITDIRKSFSGKSLIIARAGTENLLGFSGALRNMTKGTGISYQRNSFNPENYLVLNESKPR